jgi:hypothetical protein
VTGTISPFVTTFQHGQPNTKLVCYNHLHPTDQHTSFVSMHQSQPVLLIPKIKKYSIITTTSYKIWVYYIHIKEERDSYIGTQGNVFRPETSHKTWGHLYA